MAKGGKDHKYVPNMLYAMVDLVWFDHSVNPPKPYFLRDYQVMELWKSGFGFGSYDARMYLYTALMQGDRYYTEDKELWGAVHAAISGYADAKLGYDCGCREIRLIKNPVGQYLSHSLPHGISGVLDLPMRCIAFDERFQRTRSCYDAHRAIHPVLYARVKNKNGRYTTRVWCPTAGWIDVVRMPVPVCLSPYNISLSDKLSRNTLNKFITIWMSMVSQWVMQNDCDMVCIGYDFLEETKPADSKIDHLVSQDEHYEEPNPQSHLMVEYDYRDKLGALDITSRNATLQAIRAGRFVTDTAFLDL